MYRTKLAIAITSHVKYSVPKRNTNTNAMPDRISKNINLRVSEDAINK